VNEVIADRTLLAVFATFIGACVGSFLNVCISRWPAGLSVVRPRSRCPRCGHEIAWFENVPVVSWLLLRGRCRGCGLPISPMYPAVEIATALLWLFAFTRFGDAPFTALRLAVLATILLGIAVTDLQTHTIPDEFTVPGFAWTLLTPLAALLLGDSGPFARPYDALVGACAGAGIIAITGWLGEWALKREAMGFGDVTLMAVVGAALGPGRALLTMFVGATLGSVAYLAVVYPLRVLRERRAHGREAARLPDPADDAEAPPADEVPFGVFLAPAAIVTLLWGYDLIAWYVDWIT
jgi:leader peptidase (prepilin peptidase) / N-methyltransferase